MDSAIQLLNNWGLTKSASVPDYLQKISDVLIRTFYFGRFISETFSLISDKFRTKVSDKSFGQKFRTVC